MARLLTQKEVNQILSKYGLEDQNPIPCDITSQNRPSEGRLPTLDIILDRFTRMFRITLSGALRKPVDVSVRSTELVKFGEFLKSLPVPSSLNLFRMKPLGHTAIMVLETRLVFNLVDIFYGGTGKLEVKAEGRDFTPIEHRLVKRVVIAALEDFQTAWKPVFPLQMSYQRTEINPLFVAIVPQSDVVLVVTFDVEMGKSPMSITMCIPYSMMEPIRPLLYKGLEEDSKPWSLWTNLIASNLKNAEVTLTAKKPLRPVAIRDFIRLKEGDYLTTDTLNNQPVDIHVNGQKKMKGWIRQNRSRQSVEVQEILKASPRYDYRTLREEAIRLSQEAKSDEATQQTPPVETTEEIHQKAAQLEKESKELFEKIRPEDLASHIMNEHPQTIALICAHIENREKAARVIESLPQILRADVTYRMATLSAIPPGVMTEIRYVLIREIRAAGRLISEKKGGVSPTAAILKAMSDMDRDNILTQFREMDPNLADQLQDSIDEASDK